MPEKDGDEGKSTKSVVNKKQKQMMGEEGYDIARDMGKVRPSKDKKDVERVQSGKQPNKETPSTKLGRSKVDLNKYFGEEGHDIARDMGRVRPSKDKKDATTMPVSDEVKKTQKVNKGPSAFERVKAKYGKSVMNVGKKKANEELDLTQVAEAFGGYIVEKSEIRKIGKKTYFYPMKGEKTAAKEVVKKFRKERKPKDLATPDVLKPMAKPADPSVDPFFDDDAEGKTKAKAAAKKDIEKEPETMDLDTFQGRQKFKEPTPKLQKKGSRTPIGTKLGDTTKGGEVKTTFDPSVIDPKFKKKKPISSDEIRAARAFKKDLKGETPLPGETEVGKSELKRTASAKIEKPEKETKKPRSATKASPAELRQTRREIERSQAAPENQVVLSPVKTMGKDGVMRNRPLPAFGSQMSDYFKQSPAGQAKLKGIDAETGKKFDMTNPKDYDKYMKVIGSSKRAKDSAKFRTQSPDSAITRTGGKITKTGSDIEKSGADEVKTPPKKQSAFARAIEKTRDFARKDPVAALATYDLGKGVLGKILNTKRLAPGVVGGTVGRRSARGGGGL